MTSPAKNSIIMNGIVCPTMSPGTYCVHQTKTKNHKNYGGKIVKTTYMPSSNDIQREWFVIDAQDAVLGRLSAPVATILRGKHKPTFTPHMDMGDNVIIINADKVKLTGHKESDKKYYRHSNYPGGIKEMNAATMRAQHPERMVELAIKGMLPKGTLGRQMFRKLHVYAGSEHKHEAQQPKTLDINTLN